ncbi:MAG: hypothetical protein H0U57_11845 [Tatlockia sp.]|nr:hypothetical protein [Tatlockia sp.]
MNILNKLFNGHDVKLKRMAETQKEEAADLLERGKDRISEAYDLFSETVDDVYNQSKNTAKKAYKQGSKMVIDVEENLKEHIEDVGVYIKNKPVTSAIIAAGIGYLIISMLQKKSDD